VKSLGCEKSTPQLLPSHSWKWIVPAVLSAVKSGAMSPSRMAMMCRPFVAGRAAYDVAGASQQQRRAGDWTHESGGPRVSHGTRDRRSEYAVAVDDLRARVRDDEALALRRNVAFDVRGDELAELAAEHVCRRERVTVRDAERGFGGARAGSRGVA